MLNAPWYVRNDVVHNDTKIPTIAEEVKVTVLNICKSWKTMLTI